MIYGPDSTAQVTIQAAENMLRFWTPVPFSVSSPLMPALVAVVAAVTGRADQSYLVFAVLAYALGSLFLYWIVRRFQASSTTALWGALTYALAPSRLACLYGQPDGPRLLFWTLILACALAADNLRLGFRWSRLALLVCCFVQLVRTLPDSVTDLGLLGTAGVGRVACDHLLEGGSHESTSDRSIQSKPRSGQTQSAQACLHRVVRRAVTVEFRYLPFAGLPTAGDAAGSDSLGPGELGCAHCAACLRARFPRKLWCSRTAKLLTK